MRFRMDLSFHVEREVSSHELMFHVKQHIRDEVICRTRCPALPQEYGESFSSAPPTLLRSPNARSTWNMANAKIRGEWPLRPPIGVPRGTHLVEGSVTRLMDVPRETLPTEFDCSGRRAGPAQSPT